MIGVVADDTTGANDIGLMFSKNGYTAKVVTYDQNMKCEADADVLIIDTDSRLDSPEISYNKVYAATQILQELGCRQFFNKTCSVFRGNIGKEFDAMLDALNKDFAVISLAFPKNGRQTVNGIHTVHGKLLEHSAFASDPVHPMNESNLVNILQRQTSRKVTLVSLETVRQGADVLRRSIEKRRTAYNYCIVDAETQSDLAIVAEALCDFPILCGSSAIAEELPKFLDVELVQSPLTAFDNSDPNGVLVVSGSLTPQTRAQTAHLVAHGTSTLVVNSRKVFIEVEREQEIVKVSEDAVILIEKGKDVLVMADNRDDIVAETKKIGRELNHDDLAASKMVSAALADIAERVIRQTGLTRLVVAGGDTSGTVCRSLGITGNYILQEIETGLPSALALGRPMLLVLKSGSFGKRNFLETAIRHLKQL